MSPRCWLKLKWLSLAWLEAASSRGSLKMEGGDAPCVMHDVPKQATWLGPLSEDGGGAPVLAAGIVLNIFSHGTRWHGKRAEHMSRALLCTCRGFARASEVIAEGNRNRGRPPSILYTRIA
jgi:hypothetical protein